jgi:alkylated DNA repair dioxygenase AlkB
MSTRKKIVYVSEPPEGLFYIPRFLSADEETALLANVTAQPFEPYDHHGYKANREVVYFGTQGDYGNTKDNINKHTEFASTPFPEWLLPLRERIATLANLNSDELAMGLVARYSVGAGIGWHRDRPQFGPSVFGISLVSDAEMRFRRFIGDIEEMYKINLERRSAYIIGGPARSVWQHGMNPVKQTRFSITFRTMRDRKKDATDSRHSQINLQNDCLN